MRQIWTLIALCTLLTFFASIRYESLARPVDRRDQKLFLGGANAVADRKYAEATILLKMLIYTYPDSPLVGQARLLVFYSDARDESRRNEEARKILQQVEGYLVAHHPEPQGQ